MSSVALFSDNVSELSRKDVCALLCCLIRGTQVFSNKRHQCWPWGRGREAEMFLSGHIHSLRTPLFAQFHVLQMWVQVRKSNLCTSENWCVCTACPPCFWTSLSTDVQILVFGGPTEISTFGHLHGAGGTAYTLHKIIHGHKDQNKQSLNITAMQEHKDETQKMNRDMSFQTHKEISHKASAMCLCYVSLQIPMLFGITFYILGIN